VLTIPARDRSFDLVHASNVLSSVPDPIPLLNEMIRVTQPGGSIVIHNATWWSWWGGFETSPWHLISGTMARRRYVRRNGRHPENSFGFTLFRYRVKDIMEYIAADDRVAVVAAGPYWLPSYCAWILKVPVLREVATMTLSVRLERIQG
jgi:SAM-dependent methyltransferase